MNLTQWCNVAEHKQLLKPVRNTKLIIYNKLC